MKPKLVALVCAAALLCAPICGAQVTPAADPIRDVVASSFALVVKADGSVVGWGPDADGLAARGHRIVANSNEINFGGAQLILKNGGSYVAGSDHRKDGQAVGF